MGKFTWEVGDVKEVKPDNDGKDIEKSKKSIIEKISKAINGDANAENAGSVKYS